MIKTLCLITLTIVVQAQAYQHAKMNYRSYKRTKDIRASISDKKIAQKIVLIKDAIDNYKVTRHDAYKLYQRLLKSKTFHPYLPFAKNLYEISKSNNYKKICKKREYKFKFQHLNDLTDKACNQQYFSKIISQKRLAQKNTRKNIDYELAKETIKGLIFKGDKRSFHLISSNFSSSPYFRKNLSALVNDVIIENSLDPSPWLLKYITPTEEITNYLQQRKIFDLSSTQKNYIYLRQLRKTINYSIKKELPREKIIDLANSYKKLLNSIGQDSLKELAWKNSILLARKLINAKYNDEAKKILHSSLKISSLANWDKTIFLYLWCDLSQNNYKAAIESASKFDLFKNNVFKQSAKLSFWIAYALEQIGEKKASTAIYKSIIELNPLSFYSVMANKFIKENTKEYLGFANRLIAGKKELPNFNSNLLHQRTKYCLRRIDAFSTTRREIFVNEEVSNLLTSSSSKVYKKEVDISQDDTSSWLSYKIMQTFADRKQFLLSFKFFNNYLGNDEILINQSLLPKLFPRAYQKIIKRHSKKTDTELILSLIRQESAFNPKAISPVGARGLMQIMPKTARSLYKRLKRAQLFNPRFNIKLGTKYLLQLINKYEGNLPYVLMAYNAGEGNLRKWRKNIFKNNSLIHTIESIPFSETRKYVKLILRNLYFYKFLKTNAPDESSSSKIFDLHLGFKH